MMNKKFLATVFVILIYIALFFLFGYTTKRSYGCGYGSSCIRFCSSDTNLYSDKKLLEEFKESKTAKRMSWRYDSLKAIRGPPNCGEMKYIPPNADANSTDVPYEFDHYGDFEVDGLDYSVSRYCLEKSYDVYDGWKLMICYQDFYLQKGFHLFTIFLSISMLGFTLFVYAYYKELRDFNGKTIIALIGSQIITYILIPFTRYFSIDTYRYRKIFFAFVALFTSSLALILIWITVLIVHSYSTFKSFKNQSSNPYEFSTYALFAFSFSLFSGFVFMEQILDYGGIEFLSMIYFFIGLVDIILLIMTGIKILITSRHLEHSEQARFDTEKKWYWIVVKIVLMMLSTWPFEFFLWSSDFNIFSETVGDFINLLTATSILFLLVGREKARILLFGKYREVFDGEINAA